VGDVLESVEVLVLGRDLDAATPAAGAVKEHAAGIRNLGPVDIKLIIMETFVLGIRIAGPNAILVLSHGVSYAAYIEQDALGLRRDDAGPDTTFGVDLGVLLTKLIGRCRFEVVHVRSLDRLS
jgi:hypothetical protein